MADVSQTAANVAKVSNVRTFEGTAGASITAGMPVYADTTDSNKLKAADADTLAASKAKGIALHGATNGQPLLIATGGKIDVGATLSTGVLYCVSTTAGGIAPYGDLATGDFVTLLGYGDANGDMDINIIVTEQDLP